MIEIREMDDRYVFDTCPLGAPLDPQQPREDDYPGCAARARAIRRRFFSGVRARYGNCVLFAWEGERIVGFLIFLPKVVARKLGLLTLPGDERRDETLVYVCMQIVPAHIGKGAGTQLVQALIAWAKAHGWRRIEVNAIGTGHDAADWRWRWALPKWQRLGFHLAREHPLSVALDVGSTHGARS